MMLRLVCVITLFVFINGCSAANNEQRTYVRSLQKGKISGDTGFVYMLPYPLDKSHMVIQGYYTAFSHKNRMAIDFKMKKGSSILAARDGIVIRTEDQHNKGGLKKDYRKYSNYVVVQHHDGTRAGYWHLQQNGVLVNIGDTIRQGQPLGLSGNTGYSSTPHLHFVVWGRTEGRWETIPTRFMTKKGPAYLRPFRKYRNTY